ncbi:MAG: carbohydrate binding domain-containing protein [Armatimonadota bacterium]
MMRWITVLLLVWCAQVGRAEIDRSLYGINGVSAIHGRENPKVWTDAKHSLQMMQKCGAKWDRIELWWSVVQPAKGRWDFSFSDKNVDMYRGSGVSLLCILSYNNTWASSPPTTDETRAEFAEYVKRMVSRYKGQIKVWEIWNEPNIPTFWDKPDAAQYAKLLKAAYTAAKQADPTCTVLAGSTSGPDVGFLRGVYGAGGWDSCDAISIHPYSMAGGPEEEQLGPILDIVNDFIISTGKPKPLWITEMGWTTDNPLDEHKQAAYLVQSYLIALTHGVEKLFWFKLGDFSEKWGIVRTDDTPKPAYQAYTTLTKYLPQPTDMGPILLGPDVNARVLGSGNTGVIAVWSKTGQSIKTTVPLGKNSKVIDALGTPVGTVNGSITISDLPIFVTNAPAQARLAASKNKKRERRDYLDNNLLVNSNFERTAGKQIHGWFQGGFDGTANDGTFVVGKGRGDKSTCAAGIKNGKDALWDSWPVPVISGRNYTVSGWAKANRSSGIARCAITWYSGNMWTWISATASAAIPNDDQWHRFSARGKAPEDAVFARIRLIAQDMTQEALFDDLVFTLDNSSQ